MKVTTKKDFVAAAKGTWGTPLPSWIGILATAATRTGLKRTAAVVGYSVSTLSYVLNKQYCGDIQRVEQRVRGALMNETLQCPILGEIGLDRCLDEQKKKHIGTSAIRTKLFHKCRGIGTAICPHSHFAKEDAGDE